ncbi:MAG: PepSY domain-containing protein [Proteobacteria bacterium]|nr:PepSY domain-containing protein [Pseudomonadota bacterium]
MRLYWWMRRAANSSVCAPCREYPRQHRLVQPLHFGDYGGVALKTLWAVFTLLTLTVLGSGVYLWTVRRRLGGNALHANGGLKSSFPGLGSDAR